MIDGVWLGAVAQSFYQEHIDALLRAEFDLAAAAAFYVLYVSGIVFFAVAPALRSGTWRTAARSGAGLGLVAYGTYDLTNMATLEGWSVTVTVVDMIWGGILTATTATIGYAASRRWA